MKFIKSFMLKIYKLIFLFSSLVFFSGCSQAEIERKANDAGNVVGRILRGASDGLVEGLSGKEKQGIDSN